MFGMSDQKQELGALIDSGLVQEEVYQEPPNFMLEQQDSVKTTNLNDMAADLFEVEHTKLMIEVAGPRWISDNVLQGHYDYTIKVFREGSEFGVIEVERRYSDFEILRQALMCEYPGLIVPRLPVKDASVTF
jgi:hypothetical protein